MSNNSEYVLAIAISISSIVSPIIVSIITNLKDRKKDLSNVRLNWLEKSKRSIDDYTQSMLEFKHASANNSQTKDELFKKLTVKRNKLILQFKPYELFVTSSNYSNEGDILEDKKLIEKLKSDIEKEGDTNDDIEKIFVNILELERIVSSESFEDNVYFNQIFDLLSRILPVIQSGIQKNEWNRVSSNYVQRILYTKRFNQITKKTIVNILEEYACDSSESTTSTLKKKTARELFLDGFERMDNEKIRFSDFTGKNGRMIITTEESKKSVLHREGIYKVKNTPNLDTIYFEVSWSPKDVPNLIKQIENEWKKEQK